MQAKRIQVLEIDRLVNQQVDVELEAPLEPREEINFHNIWGSVTVEVEDAGANCQGTWVLFILRENVANPIWTDSVVNLETNNVRMIACGVFSASNEAPFTKDEIHPSTSRTLNAGDKLILSCHITGITAGEASVRCMICAHTTRK